MEPAWFKLLKHWQRSNRFALTIPFLFGALRNWPSQPLGTGLSDSEQMRALIGSLRDDAPDGVILRLYKCDRFQELALAPVYGIPGYCIPVPSTSRAQTALYVQQGMVPSAEALFEGLVDELLQRYGDAIRVQRFSFRAGKFQTFNDADYAQIASALTLPDEDA
ncbi:MAG: hypothetical protein Q7W02_26320 [Candidatus Rokubacteria bacterium]|nr:hypothetical protein [Candidatus Rokubacteria bacterium]